jgi:catalase
MDFIRFLIILSVGLDTVAAQCPFGHSSLGGVVARWQKRSDEAPPTQSAISTDQFIALHTINDTDDYLTTDVGGPIEDQNSLKAGERGPTLLEDFIFRQKITHFDHERVSHSFTQSRGLTK